jgi:ABC-type spermidine/putrescine transport system permease subunit I
MVWSTVSTWPQTCIEHGIASGALLIFIPSLTIESVAAIVDEAREKGLTIDV